MLHMGQCHGTAANIPDLDTLVELEQASLNPSDLAVPTLLMWSERDPAFVPDTLEAITTRFTDLNVQVIDTDSHAPFLTRAEEVLNHLAAFTELEHCLADVTGKPAL